MALGASANITGFSADALPRVLNARALNLVTLDYALLRAFLGKSLGDAGELGVGPRGMPAFERLSYADGDKFRRRFMGRTVPAGFVDKTTAAQFASHTPAYVEQRFGDQFDLAQVTTVYDVPKRTVDFLPDTDPTQTENFIKEDTRGVVAGMLELLAPALHGTSDASASTVSGWQKAFGTTGTYLGIDLTDAGNANFLAQAYSSIGSWTVGKINKAKTKAKKRFARPNICPMGETDHCITFDVLQGELTYEQNTKDMSIDSEDPIFQGIRFVCDPYMESAYANVTAGTFPLIDSRYVWVHFSKRGFTNDGLQRNPTVLSGLIAFFDCYIQIEYLPRMGVLCSGMTA